MTDMMMCDAKGCDLSKRCYRHADSGTESDKYRQSYWLRNDDSPIDDDCPQFWERTLLVASIHDGSMP